MMAISPEMMILDFFIEATKMLWPANETGEVPDARPTIENNNLKQIAMLVSAKLVGDLDMSSPVPAPAPAFRTPRHAAEGLEWAERRASIMLMPRSAP